MSVFYEKLLNPYVGKIIELFDVLGSQVGYIDWFFTTSQEAGQALEWQGNTYTLIPSNVSPLSFNTEGVSSQPTLSISNINKVLMAGLLNYDDLIGAPVIRWRIFEESLSDPDEPYLSRDSFVISQLTLMNLEEVNFKLINVMDRDRAKIPFRQVLRDEHTHVGKKYKFPGVARLGGRSR